MVCNARRSSLSSPAANLLGDVPFGVSAFDLTMTTLYVFLVADAPNDSKGPIERVVNFRCVEKPSEQEYE